MIAECLSRAFWALAELLVSLWERGMSRHAPRSCRPLAATAHPNWPADAITDLPLGAIGNSLPPARVRQFRPTHKAHAICQQCGERLAVALEVADCCTVLPRDGTAPESPTVTVAADGLQVQLPSLRDLAAVASFAPDAAADALLAMLALTAGVSDAAIARRSRMREVLDPQVDLCLH